MSLKVLQNFYKTILLQDWSTGTGTFYVTVKPTPTSGWLVVSPNNATLREIVAYTATGTDGNGDYITISARGVGGTSEQTHSLGEPIRMNITAEYWSDLDSYVTGEVADMRNDIANISVSAGNVKASDVVYGNTKLSVAPVSAADPIAIGDNDPRVLNPTMKLLKANSGTSTNTSANNLDTVSISGLTALDSLEIRFTLSALTASGGVVTIENSTDNKKLIDTNNTTDVTAGGSCGGIVILQQEQQSNKDIYSFGTISTGLAPATGTTTNHSGAANRVSSTTVTTAWTGNWTLALKGSGVTATGTLRWSWKVYKLSGQ